ncbi:hypothetical protein [Roseicyclus elongatus]|nr:hypothetical protein [Roseibacterium elongatum]
MHLAGLDRQIDTLEDLLVLFFEFNVQVLDIEHFFLLACRGVLRGCGV